MADSSALFAGATFLTWLRQWSHYHVINTPGLIQQDGSDTHLLAITDNSKYSAEAVAKAAKIGMAAGSIWFSWSLNGKDPVPAQHQLSGFWIQSVESQEHQIDLRPGWFITCGHIVPLARYTEDERDAILKDMRLAEPQFTDCRVNSLQSSDKKGDLDVVVILVAYSLADDIAVFQHVSAPQKEGEQYRFVTPSELAILPPIPDSEGIPAFLVAYCRPDSRLTEDFITARKVKDNNLHRLIMSRSPSPTTKYSYMLANYMETTGSSDPKTHAKIKAAKAPRPEFSAVFKASQRALAVGRIIPNTCQLQGTGSHVKDLTTEFLHTVSASFGCSGGMMAIVLQNGHNPLEIRVVGLLSAGDCVQPFNKMRAFTSDGIKWIMDTIR